MNDETSNAMVHVDGGRSALAKNETASTAVAARATAMVQAKFVMAIQRPRIFDDVRTELLRECDRPGFAKTSRYKRPQGRKKNEETGAWEDNFIEGWSIRFVEAAMRIMGNVEPETFTLYDDEKKRVLRCAVTDFEKNTSWATEITIDKTIERKELKKGQIPLSSRLNSYGETVYILPATDDDVRMKEARLVSITLRTLGLRLVPGDLLDDCLTRVIHTQRAEIQRDPSAARKDLVDKFALLGVKAADLVEYLGGRPLDAITPDQVLELRAVGATMKEEGAPWKDVLAASPYVERKPESEEKPADDKAAALRGKIAGRVTSAKEKAAARNAAAAKPTAVQPAAAPTLTDEQKAAAIDAGREPGDDG